MLSFGAVPFRVLGFESFAGCLTCGGDVLGKVQVQGASCPLPLLFFGCRI